MTRISNIPRISDKSDSIDIAQLTRERANLDRSWGGVVQDRAQICREGDGRFDDLRTGDTADHCTRRPIPPMVMIFAWVVVIAMSGVVMHHQSKYPPIAPACVGQPMC